ncbi:MAG: YbaK/EbsC family protein [Sulfitobacter sp.]
MSKSLKRVRAALEAAGCTPDIRETELARTAQDAARAIGCDVNQIAKSIILRGEQSGEALLFITSGGNQVDMAAAASLAGETLGKADAALIRAQTGFAIGGVSPVGHLNPTRKWFDETLLQYETVWAAAGTPHHVFGLDPETLLTLCAAQSSRFI